jgi:hypothetical protein
MLGVRHLPTLSSWRPRRHWARQVAALFTMLLVAPLHAEEPAIRHPGTPPAEAFSACTSKPPAASCYFRDGYRVITGTCQTKTGSLVCVPDKAPPGPPPGEDSSRGGDAIPGDSPRPPQAERKGNRGLDGDPPTTGRPPPRGGPRPPPEAFEACMLKSEGDQCVVKTSRGDVSGVCGPNEGRMACIPPRPPE